MVIRFLALASSSSVSYNLATARISKLRAVAKWRGIRKAAA
jgi:hypothetical protein